MQMKMYINIDSQQIDESSPHYGVYILLSKTVMGELSVGGLWQAVHSKSSHSGKVGVRHVQHAYAYHVGFVCSDDTVVLLRFG